MTPGVTQNASIRQRPTPTYRYWSEYCIKQDFTYAKSPKPNGVVERALGVTQNAALVARIQAPILFPHVKLPQSETLWAEVVHWACEALNRNATTFNLGNKSPHELWHGKVTPASPHPFSSHGLLRLEQPVEVFSHGRGLLLPRAGHRSPPCFIADSHAGKQGGADEERHLGGTIGCESIAAAAVVTVVVGAGRGARAGRDVGAGRDG